MTIHVVPMQLHHLRGHCKDDTNLILELAARQPEWIKRGKNEPGPFLDKVLPLGEQRHHYSILTGESMSSSAGWYEPMEGDHSFKPDIKGEA